MIFTKKTPLKIFNTIGFLALLILGFGCGSDIAGAANGKLVVTPDPITFTPNKLKDITTQTITLRNESTEGRIRITSIKIVENETEKRPINEFRKGELWISPSEPKILEEAGSENDSIQIELKHVAVDTYADSGFLVISVEGDPDHTDGTYSIPIAASGIGPKLLVTENPITFPPVDLNSWACKDVTAYNTGQLDLKISSFITNGNQEFQYLIFTDKPADDYCKSGAPQGLEGKSQSAIVTDGSDNSKGLKEIPTTSPVVVPPGEKFYIRAFFFPIGTESVEDQLTLKTNIEEQEEYEISVLGNSAGPCIRVLPETEITITTGTLNQAVEYEVTIENCNPDSLGESLLISSIAIESNNAETGTFNIVEDSSNEEYIVSILNNGNKVEISPGDSKKLKLSYTAVKKSLGEGKLKITSNAKNNELGGYKTYNIFGEFSEHNNPQVVVVSKICGTRTTQNMTLDQCKSGAQDPKEENIKIEPQQGVMFTISKKGGLVSGEKNFQCKVEAIGNNKPHPITKNPEYLPKTSPTSCVYAAQFNSAGVYKFEITISVVVEIDGQEKTLESDPKTIQINVQPNVDIHIELTWVSTDKQGNQGADVDLHVAYNKGNWESDQSVYHKKTTFNKGSLRMSLDRDDRGFDEGPENITINGAKTGDQFHVGVRYFTSNGASKIYAIVKIYIQGILKFQTLGIIKRGYLGPGQFWHVANIKWGKLVGKPNAIIQYSGKIYESTVQANSNAIKSI